MGGIRVSGMDRVASRLNAEIRKAPKRTKKGLIRFALLVFRNSSQMVPVEYGNLRASGFVTWGSAIGIGKTPTFKIIGTKEGVSDTKRASIEKLTSDHQAVLMQETAIVNGVNSSKNLVTVTIGYSAFYAIYVHERMELFHKVGRAKFLQTALMDNIPYARTMVGGEFTGAEGRMIVDKGL